MYGKKGESHMLNVVKRANLKIRPFYKLLRVKLRICKKGETQDSPFLQISASEIKKE